MIDGLNLVDVQYHQIFFRFLNETCIFAKSFLMKSEKELNEFFERLKKELEETTNFPTQYLYKFIVPNELGKAEALEKKFVGTDAQIKKRPSSNGKYIGVSVSVLLENADKVIHYYKEAGTIEGILSL